MCLRVLSDRSDFVYSVFNERSREALEFMLAAKQEGKEDKVRRAEPRSAALIGRFIFLQEDADNKIEVHADDGIIFELLSGKDEFVGENKFDVSLLQAMGVTGGGAGNQQNAANSSKLNKVKIISGI